MPQSLSERPFMPDYLELAHRCFNRLKKFTIDAGGIEFSEVKIYLETAGITEPDLVFYLYDIVRACDAERIMILAEKRKEESNKE